MRVSAAVIAAASIAFGGLGQAATNVVVPPLSLPGPYAVACSNVVQDFARMTPGEDIQAFSYSVNGIAQSRQITREVFAPPGTICQ